MLSVVCMLRKPRRASRKIFFKSKKKFQIQLILSNPASQFLWNLQISLWKSQNYCQIQKKKLFLMPQNYWESENIFLTRKIFSNRTFIFWFINPKKLSQIRKSFTKSRKVFWSRKKKLLSQRTLQSVVGKCVTKTTGRVSTTTFHRIPNFTADNGSKNLVLSNELTKVELPPWKV